MKTKVFFVVCLLFCMALFPLQAQNGKNGNGSFASIVEMPVYVPIIKDNVLIDYLLGDLVWHRVNHYKNGELVKMSIHAQGELTGGISGEVFQLVEQDRSAKGAQWVWVEGFGDYFWDLQTCFDNIRGNQGSHYILKYTFDLGDYLSGGSGIAGYWIVFPGKE